MKDALDYDISVFVAEAYNDFMDGFYPVGYTLGILEGYRRVCSSLGYHDNMRLIERTSDSIRKTPVTPGGFANANDVS